MLDVWRVNTIYSQSHSRLLFVLQDRMLIITEHDIDPSVLSDHQFSLNYRNNIENQEFKESGLKMAKIN